MDKHDLARRLGELLSQRQERVTTAESCTGGGVAEAITAIAGSSGWFDLAVVSYSNEAKQRLLGVSPAVLVQCGAVSEPVVSAMAAGALTLAKADWALAISGIAGPGGATADKPVGTICFALASAESGNVLACTQHFSGDRKAVREQAVCHALKMLIGQIDC